MSGEEFGKRLHALRKREDMTQEELAGQLGVTNQAVSKWELGNCYPDVELLPRLAEVFRVSVDELLGSAPKDGLEEVWRKTRALFAAAPEESVFELALRLAGLLHEGASTLGYRQRVPWKPQETPGTLDWGFSARAERSGTTARRGRAAFFSAAGEPDRPDAGELQRLAAMLALLADRQVLSVLYALAGGRCIQEEALKAICPLTDEQFSRALEALPIDRHEQGVSLPERYLHLPQLLRFLTI